MNLLQIQFTLLDTILEVNSGKMVDLFQSCMELGQVSLSNMQIMAVCCGVDIRIALSAYLVLIVVFTSITSSFTHSVELLLVETTSVQNYKQQGGAVKAGYGDWDVLVLRYDANGTQLWTFGAGSGGDDRIQSLSVNQKGQVQFGGNHKQT